MILVASPSKSFVYNSKGSAKREVMLGTYEEEIKILYNSAANVFRIDGPVAWNLPSTIDFVRRIVQNIMGINCTSDDDDFFDMGCDR